MKLTAPMFVLLFAAHLLIWFVQSESAAPTAALELDGDLSAMEAGLATASGLAHGSAPLGGREQDSRRHAADSEENEQERGWEGGIPFVFSASTGYDGSFEVGVEKGTQNLVVASALGYREERLWSVPAGKTDLVIVLEFSGTVRATGFVTVGGST